MFIEIVIQDSDLSFIKDYCLRSIYIEEGCDSEKIDEFKVVVLEGVFGVILISVNGYIVGF